MKTIYIECETKNVKGRIPFERDLLYFDSAQKKMLTFRGGDLKFRYDFNEKKLVPYVEEMKVLASKRESNEYKILDWIKNNKDLYDFEIDAEDSSIGIISISVPDEKISDVYSSLDSVGFRYS